MFIVLKHRNCYKLKLNLITMLICNISPLRPYLVENLQNMVKELSEISGKKYVLKRRPRPIENGGGFYYAMRDNTLAALIDWAFPSFNTPIKISGMHHEDTGELEINPEVKQKKYEPLVKKHLTNFFEYAGAKGFKVAV